MSNLISFDSSALGDRTQLRAVGVANPLPVQSLVPASAANKAAFVRGTKAPAAIAVPEALAAAGTYVRSVTIWAQRAARVANVSSVFIDSLGGNDLQQIEILPGGSVTLTAPEGKVLDLADIFVDSVTVTDGVFFWGML